MFVQAIEQISLKIANSPKRLQGYKILERKIMESEVLKNQLEIYTILKENAELLTESKEYQEFYDILKEKCITFKEEDINNEIKSLLEYFNINPLNVKKTVMDSAMRLNEVSIKDIVMNTKKRQLAEQFKRLIKKPDEEQVRTHFRVVNQLCKAVMDPKKKEFIKESLKTLLEERYKDFPSCMKKLYNLRRITENILESYQPSKVVKKLHEKGAVATAPARVEDEIAKFYGEDELTAKYGRGTSTGKGHFKDFPYIKNIVMGTPSMSKRPEQLTIEFDIPCYPFGMSFTSNWTILRSALQTVQRLERSFVNNTVYKGGKQDYFEMVGTVMTADLKKQKLRPGETTVIQVTVHLNTNEKNRDTNNLQVYYKQAYEMLKGFNEVLPELMGRYAAVLTPEAEKAAVKKMKTLSKAERLQMAKQDGDLDVDGNKRQGGYDLGQTELPDRYDGFFN